ncbi:MAG: EAL domain-containing protein [Magnetococcales bacterium]|nr:EAL domain-containing protein [Magnetococcales bacterium]
MLERGPENFANILKVLLENSMEGVFLMDRRGNIRQVNQAFSRLTGYAAHDLRGKNIRRYVPESEGMEAVDEIVETLWQDGFWQGSVALLNKNGLVIEAFLRVNAVLPPAGPVQFYLGQLTGTIRSESGLLQSEDSSQDPLTGLPNRMLFEDRLQQSISQSRRHGNCVGVLFLDLDRFSMVNDTLGRRMGDHVLKEVSRRLSKTLRTSDSVARIGSDEFALLLSDIDDAEGAVRNAGVVARKIYESMGIPVVMDDEEVEVSAAMGITLFPQDGDSARVLMKNADTALAHARRKGRNSYQFFSAEMTETARRRFALENNLRHALERDELRIYYQPQVDLVNGRVIGAEALIRWQHPGRGMISPADFIPVAEESGLIVPIGEWVLRSACQQLAKWLAMDLPSLRIGVNLSAVQFQRQDLAQVVSKVLEETGIPPECLDLEITESAIMEDVQKAVTMLNRISDLGVKLSIDDFGTGYSSLSQLRQFPFKTLKIDRSFVRFIQDNPGDAAIVRAIIAMAHGLGQNVIVEGLETEAQLTILRDLDCNEMQGFLFSAPVPVDELTRMLKEGKRLFE